MEEILEAELRPWQQAYTPGPRQVGNKKKAAGIFA